MERLPMRKIKDVLRLRASGHSTRKIAQSLGLGRSSARNYIQRAVEAGVSWPDVQNLDEGALERKLFHQVVGAQADPFVRGLLNIFVRNIRTMTKRIGALERQISGAE